MPLRRAGHGALDLHQRALLEAVRATLRGETRKLPARVDELDALPRVGITRHVGTGIDQVVRATTPKPG